MVYILIKSYKNLQLKKIKYGEKTYLKYFGKDRRVLKIEYDEEKHCII